MHSCFLAQSVNKEVSGAGLEMLGEMITHRSLKLRVFKQQRAFISLSHCSWHCTEQFRLTERQVRTNAKLVATSDSQNSSNKELYFMHAIQIF